MSKKIDSSVMDAALDKIATATTAVFCSAEPANYAGIAAVALITKTGLTSGSYTKATGSTSNARKVTLAAQTGMTPSANGTVTHVALHDGSTLLAVNTVTSQAVTTSQTWNSPAIVVWDIGQPT